LYDNKDVSSLSSNYQEALELFLQGELEKALVLLDNKKLEDTEKQQAENRILRGRLFYLQGDFQQARNEYQKAVSIHTSDENISYLANLYINLREYKKVCTYYRKAIKISKDRYSTVKYLTGLSWCYVQLEQYDKAETQIKKAQKLLINSQKGWIELPWAITIETYHTYAWICYEKGDYKEAEHWYHELIKAYREFLDEHNVDDEWAGFANILHSFGRVLNCSKNYQEAEKVFLEAIHIYEGLVAKDPENYLHPMANTFVYYANLLSNMQRIKEAEETYLKALPIFRNEKLKMHFFYRTALSQNLLSLGSLYYNTKQWDKVETPLLEAMKLLISLNKEDLPKDQFKTYMGYWMLGQSQLVLNETSKASYYFQLCIQYIDHLKQIQENALSTKVQCLYICGILQENLKKETGLPLIQNVYQLQLEYLEKYPPDSDSILAHILITLAEIKTSHQSFNEAASYLSQAKEIYDQYAARDPEKFQEITERLENATNQLHRYKAFVEDGEFSDDDPNIIRMSIEEFARMGGIIIDEGEDYLQ